MKLKGIVMLNAVKHPSASQDDVWRGGVPTPDSSLNVRNDISNVLREQDVGLRAPPWDEPQKGSSFKRSP